VFVFQGVLHEDDLAGRPRLRAMLERAAHACEAVVAYSYAAADALTALVGVRARAVEPGIRLGAFAPAPDPVAARSRMPAIFCAADPDEARKRVPLLVDAFAHVRRERADAELWLMSSRDQALAQAPGVRIVDPGADRDALVRLYRSAWVSVLPAYREAFGLVVAESLACGTPAVVMRDAAGALEIVDRGAPATADAAARIGWIAEPDPEELARVLVDALERPPTPDAATACRSRAELFSIERCADRYERLYEQMLTR
jgi:glycosyltransferase involved in cell wall biosynthesis